MNSSGIRSTRSRRTGSRWSSWLRLYREEGLTLRHKPRRKRRASLHRHERFRPTGANQVWSLDFVADQLADGRRFRA
jgi:putative transposase